MDRVTTSAPPDSIDRAGLRAILPITAVIWVANWGILVSRSYALGVNSGWSEAVLRLIICIAGGLSCLLIDKRLRYKPLTPPKRFLAALGYSLLAVAIVALCNEILWLVSSDYFQRQYGFAASDLGLAQCATSQSPCQKLLLNAAFTVGTLIWVFVAWCAFYVGLVMATELRDRERRLNVAERTAQEAQLSALRFQLNPHFMFNTLNTLSGLIALDRKGQAEDIVLNLSSFLRFSLRSGDERLVSVAKEIEAQKMKRPIRFCCGGSSSAAPFMQQSFFDCATHCRGSSVASMS